MGPSQDYSGVVVQAIPGILRSLEHVSLLLRQRLAVLTGHAVYSLTEGQASLRDLQPSIYQTVEDK